MNETALSVKSLIDALWRKERNQAIGFCAVVVVGQFLVQYFGFKNWPLRPIAALLFPIGWTVPIVAVSYWARWLSLKNDLKCKPVVVQGTIEKWALQQDELSPPDEAGQYISIIVPELNIMGGKHITKRRGYLERHLQISLACWRRLPNEKYGECEYLPSSKIVFRIDGKNVWDI